MITKTGSAKWQGGLKDGTGEVSTQSGALSAQPYGFATRFEDKAGTNPEELFAAGYTACIIGALKVAGRQDRVAVPDDVQVAAKVSLGKIDTGYGLAVELVVHLPGLDRDVAQALVEKAHHTCPYSNATRGNIDVTLTLA